VIRAAFTMIELIFAIVIISITALSLPMIMQVTQNNAERAISQESVYAAASVMLDVLSHPWDENAINPNAAQSLERVVNVGNNARYDFDATRGVYRRGHIRQDLHRRFHEDNTTAFFNRSNTAIDNNPAVTGMEEVGGTSPLTGVLGVDSYKEVTQYNISVNDIADTTFNPFVFSQTASGTGSNMRMIRVAMQRADTTDVVVLYGYAANIGEVDYYSRIY